MKQGMGSKGRKRLTVSHFVLGLLGGLIALHSILLNGFGAKNIEPPTFTIDFPTSAAEKRDIQSLSSSPISYHVKLLTLPDQVENATQSHPMKTIFAAGDESSSSSTSSLTSSSLSFTAIPSILKWEINIASLNGRKVVDQKWDPTLTLWRPLGMREKRVLDDEIAGALTHRRALEQFFDEVTYHHNHRHERKNIPHLLVVEDEVIPAIQPELLKRSIEEAVQMAPSDWEVMKLGSCVNLDGQTTGISSQTLSVQHCRSFCSRAYLISASAAEILLQFTAPILISYNLMVDVLARNSMLKVYETNPPLFHVRYNVPTAEIDRQILKTILEAPVQTKVDLPTRILKDTSSPVEAETARIRMVNNLCAKGNMKFCPIKDFDMLKQVEANCEFRGGPEAPATTDPSVIRFLELMDVHQLNGVVIWGLRPEAKMTHTYIHSSIHKNFDYALHFSKTRRHLCFLKEMPRYDLSKDLYSNANNDNDKLAKSLVFASPKHMVSSKDMGFLTLPVEASSLYIFHGATPRPHECLRELGRAMEWETWGPDGNLPQIDSKHFVRGEWWDLDRPGCEADRTNKRMVCRDERLFVMPWASLYTAYEIRKSIARITQWKSAKWTPRNGVDHEGGGKGDRVMRFVGSLWYCNLETFQSFTEGCNAEGIKVTRFGKWVGESLKELERLPNFHNVKTFDSMENLLSDSTYAPAVQGSCHIDESGGPSYVADRILNVISLGIYPLTNNRDAFEFLGEHRAIVYDPSARNLCAAFERHKPDAEALLDLMNTVARNHTYVARFVTLLEFLSDLKAGGGTETS